MIAINKKEVPSIDPNLALAVADDCRGWFWSQVCLCVMVSENLFYEVYDKCDDLGMVRFKNKQYLKECLKSFDKFDEWLKQNEMNCLIRDYGTQVQKRLERQIRDLYVTFKLYLDGKGQKDTEIKSHILVVTTILHFCVDTFDSFFNLYKEKYEFDTREDYMPARIEVAARNFNRFAELVILPERNHLEPTKNYASEQAFDALCKRMYNKKMVDAAGMDALKLNHMDDVIEKIERESIGLERLNEKYKVTTKQKSLCI